MRLALAATLALLVAPAAAAASTASVTEYQSRVQFGVLSYVADPGEANDVTIEGDEQSITVTDPGAVIVPGARCTSSDPHTVTCTTQFTFDPVEVTLGDDEDHFTSEGPSFEVDGGPDDDHLEGGAAGGSLSGGDGDDHLEGGAHATGFDGGDGADTMVGTDEADSFSGGPGPDSIDGRGQVAAFALGDTVSYRDHTEPVTVDLSTPGSLAGAAGEGDTISNVENIVSGDGADKLTASQEIWSPLVGSRISGGGGDDLIQGGPGADELHGEQGDDTIHGGAGNDFMGGEEGRDKLYGEGGSNTIFGFDGAKPERDSIDCGDGGTVRPGLAGMRLLDAIDQSCRHVHFEYIPITDLHYGYDRQPTRAVRTTLTCKRHCLARIAVYAHGRRLGSATQEIRRGRRATLTVPSPAAARDELAQAGKLNVGFSMAVRWGQRLLHRQVTGWHLVLHD